MSALDGLVVTGMVFKNALSECVRIRSKSAFRNLCLFWESTAVWVACVATTGA